MPSFPAGSAIFGEFFTIWDYIIKFWSTCLTMMIFSKWFRPTALDPLSVSMSGVKLGDRVLVIGCSDPKLIAALAAKAGLSGRTCAVDQSPEIATEAGRIALKEGVLVETSSAAPSAQPFERDSFDLVVMRDVLGSGEGQSRAMVVQEAAQVLRPGGRAVAIDTMPRTGIAALFGAQAPPAGDADGTLETLKSQGFIAVRVLAERDGLRFIEAVKKNS
jgi:SAM-dependent methyltransferase